MSGHGERPGEEGEDRAEERADSVAPGETVYDEDGTALGTVRGFEEGGSS